MSKGTNYWRKQLAQVVDNCGGYADRHEKFPVEWTVYCMPSLDHETIRASLLDDGWFQNETDLTLQYPDFDEWFVEQYADHSLYDMALELVVDSLYNDDGMRMWSPKTAASVLFDYVGDGADRPFDMTLETRGRGGKHVVLTEFDGVTLKGKSNSDFVELINAMSEKGGAPDDYISNVTVRRLLGMIRELNLMLTTENAEANALYYATDRVFYDLTEGG